MPQFGNAGMKLFPPRGPPQAEAGKTIPPPVASYPGEPWI
jgi:hypothetical protein